jgi:hypothetical protein
VILPYSFLKYKKKTNKDPIQGVELFESIIQNGGIKHRKLNIDRKPIANKYRKGKIKSTLKKEWKELEVVKKEAIIIFYELQADSEKVSDEIKKRSFIVTFLSIPRSLLILFKKN